MSSDNNEFDERRAHGVETATTSRLFRLAPAVADLSQKNRSIALVPASTEAHARALASQNDPFGVDWKDEDLFRCDMLESDLEYAIGDVLFTAVPELPPRMREAIHSRKKSF